MKFAAKMTVKMRGRKKLVGRVARYYIWPSCNYAAPNAVLLADITDEDGRIVTPWLWFSYTKGFRELGRLEVGEMIEFEARVKPWRLGSIQGLWPSPVTPDFEYELRHPLYVRRVEL